MGIMPPPSGVATPACTEGKRHHRGRSYGRHLSRPDAADRRSTSSRGSSRSNTSAPGATKPPSLEPSIRRALSRLYDHLKGTEKTLSQADLEFFLREMQNDRDKPYLKNVRSGTTYSFPEFCDFWYEHASHSKGPIEKLDLDKPMSNYYINSSHNTYIGDGDQVSGPVSTEQYRKASCTLTKILQSWGSYGMSLANAWGNTGHQARMQMRRD